MELETESSTPRRLDFDEQPCCATPRADDTNTPKVGMEFESDELAFEFYNNYGKIKGFSVRKEWVNRSVITGTVTSRKFTCSKEGFRYVNSNITVKYPRKDTRTGCLAHMIISLQSNNRYALVKFEEEHNHGLVTPSKTHLIRSQRKINVAQSIEIDLAAKSGLNPKETYDFMSRQAGGRENLGFIRIDLKNHLLQKRQHNMELGEAAGLLHYFQNKQVEDPSFHYSIQLDPFDQITNIFWCDSKMRLDYEQFGDVVVFDTTYRINKHCRPFAPFVGVNNHKETVVFGAALMYDETKESFKWVFTSFLNAMYGVKPKTILTDQDRAMRHAILSVLEGTYHRLCVWHLHQNALKNLQHVYKRSKTFAHDFKACIYDFEEEEDFIEAWENMLDKYNLRGETWLKETYKEREKWALVYGRHTFCADMKSTQLIEGFNATIKRYLDSSLDVLRFFEHFERVLDDVRHKELVSNYDMTQKIPRLKVDAILLRHARDVYTAKVFEWFQKEFELATNLVVSNSQANGAVTIYKICSYGKNREHFVTLNLLEDAIWCNCSKFEFVGILCCHVLKVFERHDVKIIPSNYILKRWTKDASLKPTKAYERPTDVETPKLAMLNRYKDLSREATNLAEMASHSEEDYEYLKIHLEEAKIELMKRKKSTQSVNIVRGTGLSQITSCDERNQMQVKGLKVKEGGIRGGSRLKSGLEIGSKRKKIKNRKEVEPISTTKDYILPPSNGKNSQLIFPGASFLSQTQGFLGQGSSNQLSRDITVTTYNANASKKTVEGNQYFSSHSSLLQAMDQEKNPFCSSDYP